MVLIKRAARNHVIIVVFFRNGNLAVRRGLARLGRKRHVFRILLYRLYFGIALSLLFIFIAAVINIIIGIRAATTCTVNGQLAFLDHRRMQVERTHGLLFFFLIFLYLVARVVVGRNQILVLLTGNTYFASSLFFYHFSALGIQLFLLLFQVMRIQVNVNGLFALLPPHRLRFRHYIAVADIVLAAKVGHHDVVLRRISPFL